MNNLLKVLNLDFSCRQMQNNGKLKKAKLEIDFALFEIIARYVHVLGWSQPLAFGIFSPFLLSQ